MVTLVSIKMIVDLHKQLIDLASTSRKDIDSEFEKTFERLFSELNVIVKEYYLLFGNLLSSLRENDDLVVFRKSLNAALDARAKIVMDRNRILSSIISIRAMRPIFPGHPLHFAPIRTGLGCELLDEFYKDVNKVFYCTQPKYSTRFHTIFEDIEFSINHSDKPHSSIIIEIRTQLEEAMSSLEGDWSAACISIEDLKLNKKEVMRSVKSKKRYSQHTIRAGDEIE